MASYATPADLAVHGIGRGVLASISIPVQQAALDAASDFADSLVGSRFALPLEAPFGKDLVRAVCQMAAFELLCVNGFNPDSKTDQLIEARAEGAKKWLGMVAEGGVVPNWADADPVNITSDGPFAVQPQIDSLGNAFVATPELRGW